ncbi:hypothetical protein RvY_05656 [Ramazzottius varieornatus]|uniref:Uncharacterized protein n=1 Tax=Ramazzottius varieornatus TaxID=947166 RepID=A0A1D1UVT1_RAMVA|nr:hypothetical protein RvY_05656 [Ramazzottius varieornatus]
MALHDAYNRIKQSAIRRVLCEILMESVKHEPNEQGNVLLMQACQELLVLFVTLPDGRQLLHGEPPYGQGTRCKVPANYETSLDAYKASGTQVQQKKCSREAENIKQDHSRRQPSMLSHIKKKHVLRYNIM